MAAQGASTSHETMPFEMVQIMNIFRDNKATVLEIELMPQMLEADTPESIVIVDGHYVGILAKGLMKAFVQAKQYFSKNRSMEDSQDVLDSTSVILLSDPEHLTAANFRKQRLLRLSESSLDISRAVEEEFAFLDSILTSPLHRQSKSPTLWYHRWWLLAHLLPISKPGSTLKQIGTEISTVLRSAERHKHNYYAFQHGRRSLSLVEDPSDSGQSFISQLPKQMLQWCVKNPSDTSGWSFLYYILNLDRVSTSEVNETIGKVLDFVSTTRWHREGLWVFLRTMLNAPGMIDRQNQEAIVMTFRNEVLWKTHPPTLKGVANWSDFQT
ncbi:hypothetical protein BT63DRAFT_458998 [Microthyrium microscopicum]|uniref:Protein prenylyltransferase n=1 Tax=Microthyrium microscopicum TaxID=703497 RepID=A0A6A6U004_9PEZI|nr:hypothetical protein BT63DRAFT_458998 [Microthyrium microscopicum]